MNDYQLKAHQLAMANQVAKLSSKLLKQNQVRLLCKSLKKMLDSKN